MIFDIYEQPDLFRIAKCGRRATLESWLRINHIPYSYDSKGHVIAHRRAIEAGLGAPAEATAQAQPEVKLYLGA